MPSSRSAFTIGILVLSWLLIGTLFVPATAPVDSAVSQALQANGTARVIVTFKSGTSATVSVRSIGASGVSALAAGGHLNVSRRLESIGVVSAAVDAAGLAALTRDPAVAGVYYDRPVHALDAVSNAQINADDVQRFQVGGQNVTGVNQTICVIDTGIDYRDPAFGNCVSVGSGGNCRVVGGYDFFNEDADPLDDHNHGTHVAGIAGANGRGFLGVAPNASFVALKVLNAAGNGFSSDVLAGIDWCTNNRTLYNITVISMSLGDATFNTNTCDNNPSYAGDAASINAAVNAGLFVAVASGNEADTGGKNGISGPACLTNSVAVGAVDSNDAVADFSQDWANYLILAPGVSINSTTKNNGSALLSGTSMATPHVSGLVALMQDFAQRGNGTLASVPYLKTLLNRSGVPVTDSVSGRLHYRIDALAALQAFQADVSPRNLVLQSLTNASAIGLSYAFVNVSFTDDVLVPSACILEWSNGSATNFSMTAAAGSCSVNVTGQDNVNATFRVYVNDSFGNVGSAYYAQSLDTKAPQAVTSTFVNNSALSNSSILISASFTDLNAHSCILELDGANTSNASNAGICLFNTSIAEGSHEFIVHANDSFGRTNQSGTYQFIIDRSVPTALQMVAPAANNSFTTLNYTFVNFTFTDATADTCILSYGNATAETNYSMGRSGNQCSFNVTGNFTDAASQTHNFTFYVNDSAGNRNTSGTFFITHDSLAPASLSFAVPTPADAAFSRNDFLYANLTFTEAHPVGCILQVNGTTNYSMTLIGPNGANPYCFFNVTSVAEGVHNYTVFVNDSVGLYATTPLRTFTSDRTAPTVTAMSPSTSYLNRSTALNGSANASDALSAVLNVSLAFTNGSGIVLYSQSATLSASVNYTFAFSDLSGLADGNYTLNVTAVDNASNAASNASVNVTVDSTAPTAPTLSAEANDSGFVHLNWTASTDAVGVNPYVVLRNGTAVNTTAGLDFNDTTVAFRTYYNYTVVALDAAGNANYSASAYVLANDSKMPLQTASMTAANLANGTINLTWTNVTLDIAGGAERNVSFNVYRTDNTSSTNVSNMTLLATVSALAYFDNSTLTASTSYLYVVASQDGNENANGTVQSINSVNQTTVAACTNAYSDFSACSGGSQSRTRTCLGQTETQTQSCSVSGGGGSGGSSGGSAGGSAGGAAGGSSTPSSGARGGGGGGGGSGKDLFIVQQIPKQLDLMPGTTQTLDAEVSSFYTGFLRVRNVTLTGVPEDWYTLNDLAIVSPISKTNFSIDWHPPADARGNYTVRLDIVGVGTKNAGLLNTSYTFQLVLPPAEPVGSQNGAQNGAVPLQQVAPSATPIVVTSPARTDFSTYLYFLAGLLVVGLFAGVFELWKWRQAHGAEDAATRAGVKKTDKSEGGSKGAGKAEKAEKGGKGLPTMDDAAEKGVELPKRSR